MKKKFIFCLCLCALFVTGCGCSKKENLKTIKCTLKKDNYQVTILFEYDEENGKIFNYERKEKIVDKELIENKTKYDSFLITMKNWSDLIENYDYKYTLENDQINTVLNVDFDKADVTDILNAPGLYSKFYDYEKNIFDINLALNAFKNDDDYVGVICK